MNEVKRLAMLVLCVLFLIISMSIEPIINVSREYAYECRQVWAYYRRELRRINEAYRGA